MSKQQGIHTRREKKKKIGHLGNDVQTLNHLNLESKKQLSLYQSASRPTANATSDYPIGSKPFVPDKNIALQPKHPIVQ